MTTRVPRDLIALSDGTGNSASKPFKTNVWRLYQALNLRDGSQVAEFGDGVGNSSISILRVLGLALGIGAKRNVLNLYKFLCHNYWRDEKDPSQHDRIWMFGFSRGGFTIRVLAGLVHSEGLVKFETEAELNQNAIAAYRAFRKKAFPKKRWFVFWVPLGRAIRDGIVWCWQKASGGTPYRHVERQENIEIHFVGVWDTVAAYGLPIDELTIAVDKWVWPMKFEDTSLLERVKYARHAMGLDDERRTFHPIPWNEHEEIRTRGKVDPARLTQVWFPGMHSDVGGGYPDDGLSFVPLCWMIDEAKKNNGLKFENAIVNTYRALASPTGRIYDSRGGLTGSLWRYQPRNVQFLMDNNDDTMAKEKRITPLVHHCTVTRMNYGNDGYAPKALPLKIDILLPNDRRVAFDGGAVNAELKNTTDAATKTVLGDLKTLIETASAQTKRGHLFALVIDSIWLRRLNYFVTLGLVLVALAFPFVYALMDWGDKTAKINQITGGAVSYLLRLFKGMIPSYASPWVDAVSANAQLAVNIVILLVISLVISKFLELRIKDRSRAMWNVQPRVGGKDLQLLRLAGQRHALIVAAIVLTIVAIFSYGNWKSFWAAVIGVVVSLALVVLRWKKGKTVDPTKPPFPLNVARSLRNNGAAVWSYRWLARTGLPAAFILIVLLLVLSVANLGLYNLRATQGAFCEADPVDPAKTEEQLAEEKKRQALNDKLGSATVDIGSPCARMRLWLVAGRQYRIQIEPGWAEAQSGSGQFEQKPEYAWFDKGTPADVTGFGAAGKEHYLATTLKRWWRENYFRPIARVGSFGNYEYPLHPVAPLPKVDFSACGKAGAPDDVESPAPLSERENVLKCEGEKKIQRNARLISDIRPDSTGELYIYVNDAIRFWDSRNHHKFYKNNSGKAKVTVTRTLAPAMVDATPTESKN